MFLSFTIAKIINSSYYCFSQCITFVAGMEKNIQDKDLGVITLRTLPGPLDTRSRYQKER